MIAGANKNGWNEHSGNFWLGCSKVSPACDNCTAQIRDAIRYKRVGWGLHAERVRTTTVMGKLRAINRAAARAAEPITVFINSGSDFFDRMADPAWRAEAWDLINESRWIVWLILTKRPQNIRRMLPEDWGDGYPNVWLGVTAENQREARRRLPVLLRVPCVRRYASVEPMLETMDLSPWLGPQAISWIICGGETAQSQPRPLDPAWARDLRQQCTDAGVWFYMKQLHGRNQTDAKVRLPEDLRGLTERPPLLMGWEGVDGL